MKAITLLKEVKNKSELAQSMGISSQMIQMWISRKSVPSKHLKSLAKALNVKVDNLL